MSLRWAYLLFRKFLFGKSRGGFGFEYFCCSVSLVSFSFGFEYFCCSVSLVSFNLVGWIFGKNINGGSSVWIDESEERVDQI